MLLRRKSFGQLGLNLISCLYFGIDITTRLSFRIEWNEERSIPICIRNWFMDNDCDINDVSIYQTKGRTDYSQHNYQHENGNAIICLTTQTSLTIKNEFKSLHMLNLIVPKCHNR